MASKRKDAYAKAGVSIDEATRLEAMIKEAIAEAWPDVAEEIGGFAGGGPIPFNAEKVMGSVDGTGTKIFIAALLKMFFGIGQDAVAMAAVDDYVAGSVPTYLLDNLKAGELDADLHIEIIKSVIRGCKLAGCKLIGGETAEHPGMYKYPWLVDLDATSIGFPNPADPIYAGPVEPGQVLYGWLSGCIGANGFSLVRDVFRLTDKPSLARKRLKRKWAELGDKTLGEVLLEPTPIHIQRIEASRAAGVQFTRHAHITGEGLPGNVIRMLPDNCVAVIERNKWTRPAIFRLIEQQGSISRRDMDRTFNEGLMMVSAVNDSGSSIHDDHAVVIGYVAQRQGNEPQVQLKGRYRNAVV